MVLENFRTYTCKINNIAENYMYIRLKKIVSRSTRTLKKRNLKNIYVYQINHVRCA